MARAAVIPASPPKRATRGRAKGPSTKTVTATASKQTGKVTKSTLATDARRKNARTVAPAAQDSESEETDDEIGVIESKSRAKTGAGPRGRSVTAASTGVGRGRPKATAMAAAEVESDSEDDDDELAQSDAPKKRAARKPKATAKEGAGKAATATARPRGRPKGTTTKTTPPTDEAILKENTRRNALSADSDDLSSSQGPAEIFIKTGSTMLRDPARKKKTVTFQELSESEASGSDEETNEPTLPTRRRRGTIVAKNGDGLGAKPVRKAPATSTRGRKPAAAKRGGVKPLSPKKATQVAKAISSYASSEGEDELNAAKDAIKLVVNSPQKHEVNPALNSPVRRINFTPSKPSKTIDENGETNLPPSKAFDFGESQFMSSPARRPPPSPFHFTLKETPKRAGLSFRESTRPIDRPESPQAQNSPLRLSPRKANLGTPARGSLFLPGGDGVPAQPNFTPARDSPLKTSPRKGLFGASFSSSQQPQQQASTPFKTSLLMSPAKKVNTPFKSSINRAPSSLAKETRVQDDSDDETVSMYDQSPLRAQNLGGLLEFDDDDEEEKQEIEEEVAEEYNSGNPNQESPIITHNEPAQYDSAGSAEDEDYEEAPEDEIAPLEVEELDQQEQNIEDGIEELEDVSGEINYTAGDAEVNNLEMPLADDDVEGEEAHGSAPRDAYVEDLSGEDEHEEQYLAPNLQEEPVDEDSVRRASTFTFSAFEGLEDVFTESPAKGSGVNKNTANEEAADDPTPSEAEELAELEMSTYRETIQNESRPPKPVDEDLIGSGPVQPYEVEEVADTPFVNFLMTYWVSTLPLADVLEDPASPVTETQVASPDGLPEQDATPAQAVPEIPAHSIAKHKEGPQPVPNRGPRFTLLAEQLSQWKASSPSKIEEARPRRRGVFSLAGRRSDVGSDTPRAITPRTRSTDIFANAPTLPSATPRNQIFSAPVPATSPKIHEDEDEPVGDQEVELETPTREPMGEIAPETFTPEIYNEGKREELELEDPAILETEDEKENEIIPSPALAPATPVENPPLSMQTFHTVSKVPLKPEGEISPLKICRKRGRSLSITSPVRSSPRLRNFVLPPPGQVVPDSPPRKSPRLQEGSARKQARESLSKPTEPMRSRSRTPSRSASPSKTPRKQVAAYNYCLRGAVVYVDVHTTEGEDASGLFVEALQEMGARCVKSWSWNPRASLSPEETADSKESRVGITHVVFKDGGVRTLEKVRAAAGLVKCVGVGWVLDCESANKWLDETPYAVDSSIIPRGGAKRRKSMEPRALANVNGTLVKNGAPSTSFSTNRRQSEAARNISRSITPAPRNNGPSTPETTTRKNEPDYKFWQTPRTPGAAALGYNMDSIGMSPATPFYLSQRSKLVQQTCPPKQTRQGLFSKSGPEEETSQRLKAKLEAARRKSLAFKPAIGSPLVE